MEQHLLLKAVKTVNKCYEITLFPTNYKKVVFFSITNKFAFLQKQLTFALEMKTQRQHIAILSIDSNYRLAEGFPVKGNRSFVVLYEFQNTEKYFLLNKIYKRPSQEDAFFVYDFTNKE